MPPEVKVLSTAVILACSHVGPWPAVDCGGPAVLFGASARRGDEVTACARSEGAHFGSVYVHRKQETTRLLSTHEQANPAGARMDAIAWDTV